MIVHTPRKRFGQHFLTDEHLLQKIADSAQIIPADHCVEIGPGQGALTRYLLAKNEHLQAIEIDRDLIRYLEDRFKNYPHFNLIEQDVLSFNWQTLAHQAPLKIIGNLPYNISTALLFKLFASRELIQEMFFLLQKEVAVRITAAPGDTQYSRLSVMSQYFCECRLLLEVPPEAFFPPPKVDSCFLSLKPRQHSLIAHDEEILSQIVKTAFTFRRKTISNALKSWVNTRLLEDLQIPAQKRPQDLSVADYVRISRAIDLQ